MFTIAIKYDCFSIQAPYHKKNVRELVERGPNTDKIAMLPVLVLEGIRLARVHPGESPKTAAFGIDVTQ